jgi:hypothetical protein
LHWDPGGLLLGLKYEKLAEMKDLQHADWDAVSVVTGSPGLSEAWDIQTVKGSRDSDDIGDSEDTAAIRPSSLDIISWYEDVTDSEAEFLPLTPTPLESGVIGGLSVNDILMIKGLIDPPVYIQFFDLHAFSHL